MKDNMRFKSWLEKTLKEEDMRPSKLADLMNVDRQLINTYLNRNSIPDTETCKIMATALNKSPLEVMIMAGHYDEVPADQIELDEFKRLFLQIKDQESKKTIRLMLKAFIAEEGKENNAGGYKAGMGEVDKETA